MEKTIVTITIQGLIFVITVIVATACFAFANAEGRDIYLSEPSIDMMIIGNDKGTFKPLKQKYKVMDRNTCLSCYESNLSYHRLLMKKKKNVSSTVQSFPSETPFL